MANLPLLDPFTTLLDYPDTLLTSIRSGHSTCTRFSPDGQYLASGRLDGVVVVFDVDTRSVARRMRGHVGQVQSVSWSVDGRWLVSAGGVDWGVVRWDLADEKYALEKGGDNGEEEEEEQIKMGGENRIQLGKVAFGVEICPSDP